ncbi:serine/threonine-protein kinase [Streptomyces griseus]|uniref:serine/threonine-protein kinase n=1 Tax=Streptomyces griseus TaxID=1911 RepID=UPI00056D50D2
MGRVWRAVDEMLDRLVAVKEMRIDGLDAEDTRTRRERALREARATARIDHPNVVRVYDVVDEGERLWIVMELIHGRSLERIMAEDGPLGPLEAARTGLELIAALREVHAGGVLHRDIKPGNVLVEGTGRRRVVLTDFGIAAIEDTTALTMVGMLVGSPDYMAPERVSGRPQGPPSDLWSLGATLCASLAGHSPFSRDTTLATLHAVLYEEPELPPTAGPLTAPLAHLLHKDPTARPTLDTLESALREVAYPAPTPTLAGEAVSGDLGAAAAEPPGSVDEPERPEDAVPAADGEPVGEDAGPSEVDSDSPAAGSPSAAPDDNAEPPEGGDSPAAVPDPRSAVQPDMPTVTATPSTPTVTATPSTPTVTATPSTPTARAIPAPPRRAPGVSLSREEAVTEERPEPRSTLEFRRASTPRPAPRPEAAAAHGTAGASGGELPGPALPARPATPSSSRTRGRRRTALLAAAGVLTAGAVVTGVVLASPSGSPDGTRAGPTRTTTPATVAGRTPSATVEGTSKPPSLPPGAHEEAGGFAWVTPKGWRRDMKTGAEVHYTSPDGRQELVGKSSLARGDLMETWESSEESAHQGRAYRKIRLAETTFRDHPAVVWEYTFTLQGTPWHARLLGFNAHGKSYQVNIWYRPDAEPEALETYDEVKDSFTLL